MALTVVLIEDKKDIENLDLRTLRQSSDKIYSMNIECHKLLEQKKIEHEIAENFLTKEDHFNLYMHTSSFWNWYSHDKIPKTLEFEGINILGLFNTTEFHNLIIRELYGFFTVKRIIEKINPNKIIANNHLIPMIKLISKKSELKVDPLGNVQHEFYIPFREYSYSFQLGKFVLPIKISRKKYYTIKNTLEYFFGKLFGLWYNTNKKKSILFLEFNTEQYSNLIKHIRKLDRNIIFLNTRRSAIWNFNSIKLLKNSNCKIITPSHFLSKNDKMKIRYLTEHYQKNLSDIWLNDELFFKIFMVEQCSFWPLIKNALFSIYHERMEDYIEIIMLSKYLTNLEISCIVSLNVFGETEKAVLNINNKTRSILLEHGFTNYVPEISLFDNSSMYNSLFKDKIALWGEIQKQYLVSQYNIQEEKILVCGSPRYDSYFKMEPKLQISSKKTILITPGMFDETNGLYDTKSFLRYEMVLTKLFSELKKIPDIEIIVKLHPDTQRNNLYIEKFIEKLDPGVTIHQFSSIKDVIGMADLIINIHTELFPSTVLLEGMIMKKPIMNIRIPDEQFDFEFIKDEAVLQVSYDSDFQKPLQKILSESQYKRELIENGVKHVSRYLSHPGQASVYLADILNSY